MGVVYLGKDPKIGRVVAIKTMALSQEFEADELAEVKERFFREAETAGRLSHPNIVTIYDAGEEHDLCYIAMELLKGRDLVPYTKPAQPAAGATRWCRSSRAPPTRSATRTRRTWCTATSSRRTSCTTPETDTLKVTDFGIARITDSSKTKTGMVLGTPSYMSPEQLAGKKIEGRSDLFSLAVSLYQLLCGKLPFEGESMAQLMFKIANEPPTDILSVNPQVPPRAGRVPRQGAGQEPRRALPDRRGVRRGAARRGRRRAAPRRRRRQQAAWTSSSERTHEPEPGSRNRQLHRPGHGPLAQRGFDRLGPGATAWWCWPTAWAATTRARSRAAWRPR